MEASMSAVSQSEIVEALAESLEIPVSAYEAADRRYLDLGNWLRGDNAQVTKYDPYIYSQGSFRLGTAIKPWKRQEYDVDLVCVLRKGIEQSTTTQSELKGLVGTDLESYRINRRVEEKLEETHRCWRLRYQDTLQFHMDAVPAIPQTQDTKMILFERMMKEGNEKDLSINAASLAIAITDDRHPSFKKLSNDWNVSNPEGYALWFESRMRRADVLLESRAMAEKVGKIDELPLYRWRTPLQRAVQILKRHRDVMFEKNPKAKPISIIITTLAAQSYSGESDISSTLQNVIANLQDMVSKTHPKVVNPVNPAENFADKWETSEGRRLRLQEHFFLWTEQVANDLETIASVSDRELLREQSMHKFGVPLSEETLSKVTAIRKPAKSPVHIGSSQKPWNG
jgi:hypothetical protein